MQLDKNMLPSIDWAGLSVKVRLFRRIGEDPAHMTIPQYFLEVSVLFGQDECRARIPIRIV